MAKAKKRRWRLKTNADLFSNLNQLFIIRKQSIWKLLITLIIFVHEFLPPNGVSAAADEPIMKLKNFNNITSSTNYSNLISLSSTTSSSSQTKLLLPMGDNVNNNNMTFDKLSRKTFNSLDGVNFEDDPLPPPDGSKLTRHEKRILNNKTWKRNRKNGLPGRRRAFAIATKEAIKPGVCRVMQMKQRVRMDGCVPKNIVNNFCYGQCNSFFIPKLSRKRLRTAFESCSVCQPTEFAPITVKLDCPARSPPYVEQQIMTIKNCSCKSVCTIANDVL